MRLMVMFDLPTETSKQRKQYRQFRKKLINEGFIMIQYSVYVRVCTTKSAAEFLEKRIKDFLPDEGIIQSLVLTEKQYSDMHFLRGKMIEEVRNSSKRTVIL
ncbi:MAG: CRISPR-associated endonuclease Cas2 [Limosilactobacillus gorillae]|uniref:CRISPR-associated endonuclease Cas2 n=1 Tax=Limosilactobacillus gorillae TaxID=1450649 RepID=UPI000A434280|nr:CRISPR-associated endonuclease Cas2 [Limosilactobacillus gorillae]MDO4855341.1 CRISPR-associated endonuclease Cas2 [Limosilactobacillus gorillae]